MKKKRKTPIIPLSLVAILLMVPPLLLESRSFQTKIARRVTKSISENLPINFHIDSLAFSPSRMCVELYGLSATDSLSQPVLNVRRIDGSIRLIRYLIKGEIALNNIHVSGFDLHLTKDSLNAPLNISSLFPQTEEKGDSTTNPINLNLRSLMIFGGHVSYDVLSEPHTGTTDANHLSLSLNTQMSLKLSLNPVVSDSASYTDFHANLKLNKFSLKEQHGFSIDKIKLHASIDNDSISVDGLQMEMPHSSIQVNPFIVTGSLEKVSFLNTATLQADFSPTDFPALRDFFRKNSLPQYGMKIVTSVNGSTDRLNAAIKVQAGDNINIDGWCQASDLLSDNRKITSHWKQLGVSSHLTKLLEQAIPGFTAPAIIDAIGYAIYSGDINLTGIEPEINGTLSTAIGDIALNASLDKVDSIMQVVADVSTTDLSVEKLGMDFLTGPASFHASVNGFLPHENMPLKANATVNVLHASLLSYNYENIEVNASANGKLYEATLHASDANCNCLMDASYDMRRRKPEATVSLKAPHINLHELHLLESNDGKSDLAFNLDGHVSGSDVKEIVSSLKLEISDIHLSNNGESCDMNRLTLISGKHNDNTYLQLTSPLMNGRIVGTSTFIDMVECVKDGIVNRYLPSLHIGKSWKPSDDLYQFAFNLHDTQKLFKAVGLPLTIEGIADVDGSYNNETGTLLLSLESSDISLDGERLLLPSLSIGNQGLSHLEIQAKSGLLKEGNKSNMRLNMAVIPDSISLFGQWNGFAISKKGALDLSLGLHSATVKDPLEIWASLSSPSFFLDEEDWCIDTSVIHIQPEHYGLQNLSLHSGDKFLRANGTISPEISDTFTFDLRGIRLDDIFAMLPAETDDPFTLGGVATAKGQAISLLGTPHIDGKVSVDKFAIQEKLLGDLQADTWWDEQDNCIKLVGDFSQDTLDIANVSGSFIPESSNIVLDVKANGLPIDFVGAFLEPTLTIKGPVYGDVGVNVGLHETTDILLDGHPRFNGEIGVNPIGAKFLLNDIIELHPKQICFNKIKVTDELGHTGMVDGDLKHDNFQDIHFNLGIDMQSLQAFNLPSTPTSTIYGKVLASGKATITGTDKDIHIDANAKTENPSSFSFALGSTSVSDYGFIHFIDHSQGQATERTHKTTTKAQSGNNSLKINLQLDVTDDTEINLLTDQATSDGVHGRGNGKIRIEYDPAGDVGLFGDYELISGNCRFNFKNTIQRTFTIESGSKIHFSGDPLKAQMGVNAYYHVNSASLSGLLSESDIELLNMTRPAIPVNCLLALSGELQQPEIHMDLSFPNADAEVERKIRSVINTDEVLSRQVVYLLVLNNFAPTDNSSIGNTATSNINAVWGATLNGLSSQLSQVLTDALGTENFSFGFNYNTDINTGTNEWQVAMTGNWLDNRLKINGNVGQRENFVSNTSNQFIGDFDLEYKLTQRLRLKAYSHSNDSRYFKSATTTQGLGIVVKDSFNSLSQLWNNWVESFKRQKARSLSYSDILPKE